MGWNLSKKEKYELLERIKKNQKEMYPERNSIKIYEPMIQAIDYLIDKAKACYFNRYFERHISLAEKIVDFMDECDNSLDSSLFDSLTLVGKNDINELRNKIKEIREEQKRVNPENIEKIPKVEFEEKPIFKKGKQIN